MESNVTPNITRSSDSFSTVPPIINGGDWGRIVPDLETGDYTLSGRIGKVVASHAAVARSIPAEVALIYTMHEALSGYCP